MSLNSEWNYEPRQVIDHTSEIEIAAYGQTHKLSVSGLEKQYTGSFEKRASEGPVSYVNCLQTEEKCSHLF